MIRLAAALALAAALSGCLSGQILPGPYHTPAYDPPRQQHDTDYVLPVVLGVTALVAVVALVMRDGESERAVAPRSPTDGPVRFAGAPDPAHIERMFVQGRALASAGRCDGVHAIGRNVMRLSYDHITAYTTDPVIAPCYEGR